MKTFNYTLKRSDGTKCNYMRVILIDHNDDYVASIHFTQCERYYVVLRKWADTHLIMIEKFFFNDLKPALKQYFILTDRAF